MPKIKNQHNCIYDERPLTLTTQQTILRYLIVIAFIGTLMSLVIHLYGCGDIASTESSTQNTNTANNDSNNDSHDGVSDCHTSYETEDDGCSTMVSCNNIPQDGPFFHPVPCSVVIAEDEATSPNPSPEPEPTGTVFQGFKK